MKKLLIILHDLSAGGAEKMMTRLAGALVDACLAIVERPVPPVAVALVGAGDAYYVLPPHDVADCDAATPAWAEATAAIARLTPPTVAAIGGDGLGPAWELALSTRDAAARRGT